MTAALRMNRTARPLPALVRLVVVLVVVVGLGHPSRVHADETLDMPSFLARVRSDSVAARAIDASIVVADARTGIARIRPSPGLEVGLAQLDVSGQGAPTASFVGVTVPIEVGGDRRARRDEAGAARALVGAEAERAHGQLAREAALAFVDAVEAEELAAARRASLASIEHVVALTEARVARGDLVETEFLRAAVARDRLAAELLHAEGDARAARARLPRFLETDAAPFVPVLEPAHVGAHAPRERASWLEAAFGSRQDLRVAAGRVELARSELARVRAARRPDLLLGASWIHNGATSVDQFRQRANDVISLTLGIPLPFGNRRGSDVDTAEARIAEVAAESDAARMQIAAEVNAAFEEHEGAHAAHAAFEGGVSARARLLVERTTAAFERDAATMLELLDARRAADEIEAAHVAARASHARARIELEAAAYGTVRGF